MKKTSVTIADVAQAAGVSRAAVSKVIRNAYGVSPGMREKVQSAIDELGYRPSVAARAMRGASYTIGVELPNTSNPLFERITDGLTRALARTPYRVVISPSGDIDSREALQTLLDLKVDGILAVASSTSSEWLEETGRHVPLVLLGRHEQSQSYDTIVDDDALGTRLALSHLHALGHRAITHLTIESSTEPDMAHSPHAIRAAAYADFMTGNGLEGFSSVHLTEPNEDAAYLKALEILDAEERPTAIYAGHDELALGVLRATTERGLNAADLSVVGYDDSRIASHPLISLTTINQFAPEIGERVGAMLLERIAGRTNAVRQVITPELRIRNSSTAPTQRPRG